MDTGRGGPSYRDVTISNPAVAGTAGAMVSTVPYMTRYAPMLPQVPGFRRRPRHDGRAGAPEEPTNRPLRCSTGF